MAFKFLNAATAIGAKQRNRKSFGTSKKL